MSERDRIRPVSPQLAEKKEFGAIIQRGARMTTHNSRYGWMALGGLVCLFAVVFALKLRDGNRAQAEMRAAPATVEVRETAEPELLPPLSEAKELPPIKPDGPALPEPTRAPEIIPAAAAIPAPPAEPNPPSGSNSRPILIPAAGPTPPPVVTPPVPPSTVPDTPTPTPSLPSKGDPLPPIATEPVPTVPTIPAPPTKVTPTPPVPPPAQATPVTPAQIPESPRVPQPIPTVPATAIPPSPAIQAENRKQPAEIRPARLTTAPTMSYRVRLAGENFRSLARKTLGSSERWTDLYRLNPTYAPDAILPVGSTVVLPAHACIQEDSEDVQPLPVLRPRSPARAKAALPLTGTYLLLLDEQQCLTLPQAILEQLGNPDTVMLSPGSDRCLWLTSQVHLDRLQAKLDRSPARYSEVRNFMRLYYAQAVKAPVQHGRVTINDRLAQFAGLQGELVLVGIDDHFEVWNAAKWRQFAGSRKLSSTEE